MVIKQSSHQFCLIADDEGPTRELIRTLLSCWSLDFIDAADGSEAVQLYHEYHPCIVVMDIEMRPVDGLSAAREIRREDPGSRIVMISKHTGAQMRQASIKAGARAFVTKEHLVTLRDLVGKLLLERTETPSKPPSAPGTEASRLANEPEDPA